MFTYITISDNNLFWCNLFELSCADISDFRTGIYIKLHNTVYCTNYAQHGDIYCDVIYLSIFVVLHDHMLHHLFNNCVLPVITRTIVDERHSSSRIY